MNPTLPAAALALVLLLAPLSIASADDADATPLGFKARAVAEIQAAGLDPDLFLAKTVTLSLLGEGPMQLGDALDAIDAIALHGVQAGVAGTPGTTVGDFQHFYYIFGTNANYAYQVSESAFVPATPTLAAPAEEAPFFDVGGTMKSVTGSWGAGFHTVGTTVGSNVDTHESGPYAPIVSGGGIVPDTQMDFRGHAEIEQSRSCIFGFCFVLGTMVATGAATWDPLPGDVRAPAIP